jgi:hypothetical protein
VLGESAAVHPELEVKSVEEKLDGFAKITLADTKTFDAVELEAERKGGRWRLAPSPGLIASDKEVFKAPAGSDAPTGLASADAVAERWKAILETGTGWDAYNLMSPAMHKRLNELVASVGGSGGGDVAKIFEKTIVDRRNRGLHVKSATLEHRTADSASLVLVYSDGKSDTFTCVRANGSWWLEMPF